MSTPKGYTTSDKDDRLKSEFVTVSPIGVKKYGLDVIAHGFVQSIGSDTTEANSSTYEIVATAHSVLKGDKIRLTSGTYSGREIVVVDTETNSFTLGETLPTAIGAGITFDILRPRTPVVNSAGAVSISGSSGIVTYTRNAADQAVTEDTVTPANNRALPVKLLDTSGNENTVAVSSSALPTGAATEATLSAASAKLPATLGQKAMAASMAVVIASDQSAVPASQSGTWNINNVSGTVSLPTGAATEATLSTLNGKIAALGQAAMAASHPVVISSDQSAIPASQSGTWNINNIAGTISLPTGAATEATLSAASAKLPATLGQKTMANSMAVVLSSDQSAIPASQSGTWNINNVSGTVSLPTGAATEATLSTLNGKIAALGQAAMAASHPVVISSDQSAIPASQSGTWNINNISGTVSLPTGAATEATLSAASAKLPATLGQKTMANSLAVVLASDQSTVNVALTGTSTVRINDGSGNSLTSTTLGSNVGLHTKEIGSTVVNRARNDYSSTSVTTAAYVQLLASTSAEIQSVEIFDSSGQTLVIATGAAASEVDQAYVFPGGNGRIPLRIASGTRVSIKAVSATANSGEIAINFYS